MFDCHVHSSFSGDSEMDSSLACDTAISLGLSGIAFTDHLDYDYPDYDDVFMIDFTKYSKHMDELKARYQGKLTVMKGIEVGIQPHVMDDTAKTISRYDFDFVIASVHIVDKTDLHNGDFCREKKQSDAYVRYLEEVYTAVSHFKDYDVLGHLDLIRRYGGYDNKTLRYHDYSEIIDCILRKVISTGKGIEVNTSGYRYGLNSSMPDIDILKRYYELGGEVITTGSDAHSPQYISYQFDFIAQVLKEIGFKYTAHFEKRKAVYNRL